MLLIKKNILLLIFLILSSFGKLYSQVYMDWVAQFQNVNNGYGLRKISTDNSGNIISVGDNNFDYLILKYNSKGELLWETTYDYIGLTDAPTGMVIDDSDNVYITGASESANSFDYATVKFDSSGKIQWVSRYNGDGNGSDRPNSITIDSKQNIYVTGKSITDLSYFGYDILTIKYNSDGEQQWVRKYNGTRLLGSDEGNSITVDKSDNIYVTGTCVDSIDEPKYCTIKYSSDGTQQWVAKYDATPGRNDIGYFVKTDVLGNVFVTGISFNELNYFNFATVKYNSEGIEQWSRKYIGSANFQDRVAGLEVDDLGNAYIVGRSTESGTGYDYTTIKYNTNGDEIWIRRYHNGFNDIPNEMTIDTLGNIYITGQSDGEGTDFDVATVKYDSSGNQKWAIRYNYSGQSEDVSRAIALDKLGNVYIAGKSDNIYVTIKYSQNITGVNPLLLERPTEYILGQNYPNPFNPSTNLGFGISKLGFVTLRVYDVLGNEVTTLINETKLAGNYQIKFDGSNYPSGVYFYKLEAGDFTETKRMVLLK